MYIIRCYVPESHVKKVKNALFESGAGKIGQYKSCCWQTSGLGQFMPMPGSDPYLGKINEVEEVKEVLLELVCSEEKLKTSLINMIKAHPYEEPAYHWFKVNDGLPE